MSDDTGALGRIKALLDELPQHIVADWIGTNHFELSTDDDTFWAVLRDGTKAIGDNPWETEEGRRIGLILDTAASYAGDVRALVAEHEALQQQVKDMAFIQEHILGAPDGKAELERLTARFQDRLVEQREVNELKARVAELEAENERLRESNETLGDHIEHLGEFN